ncbi:thioredoxin-related transmembrane protein 1-like [Amphiura filiformis]|uniref:thioredoxin-related transmembrane protein 1-like n=1 Tax=Amphiura filiformis TaxID=82378 RepID=UPI003B210F2F
MALFRLKELSFFAFALVICIVSEVSGGQKGVTKITDENWQQVLEGEWLVEFYAPWCPACKALGPTWDAVGDWAADLDINVAAVDVTEEAGLSGRFMITSLPSIYHVIDGEFRRYMGPRTENDIITFIEDRKFHDVETVASWRAPDSISMGIVSFIFKVSMKVRVFHNIMTEKYGFPIWVTYGFLAIFTVAFGLFLGLILVFLTDCCCPQKPPKGYERSRLPEEQQATPPTDINESEEEKEDKKADEPEQKEEVVDKAEGKEEEETTLRQRKTGGNEDGEEEGESK